MDDSDLQRGFYLRSFFVTPRNRQVGGAGEPIHLTREAMTILVCLAANAGRTVSRETLSDAIGDEGSAGIDALDDAVDEIRQALGDDPHRPGFVQTMAERGYRLLVAPLPESPGRSPGGGAGIAAVSLDEIGLLENLKRRGVIETAVAYLVVGWLLIQVADIVFDQLMLPPWLATFVTILVIAGFPIAMVLSWFLELRDGRAVLHELSPEDARRRRFSRTYLSVIGALAIAGLFVFAYDRSVGLPGTAAPVTSRVADDFADIADNTIAVLPLVNVDGSDETQVFANGLADDVITRLSRVPGLLVSSRGDSFTLAPNSPSEKVRERLRVARYLEGSVQLAENRMRIIVQLIDARNGFQIFSDSFDRPKEDFFDIRDEVTELTVANIRVTLPPETQAESVVSPKDPNLDAYVLYRRGAELLHRSRTGETLESAIRWFDSALGIDGNYAAAHAGKCTALVFAYQETNDPDYIEAAQAPCSRALALNPNLDVVHTALGELYFETGDYDSAERAFKRALAIVPSSVAALTGLGDTYLRLQRMEAAEASFRQAVGLHPGDWSAYNRLGGFFYRFGRYEEAVAQFRRVVDLDRANATGFGNLGSALLLVGDLEGAAAALQRANNLEPDAGSNSNLGLVYYYLGDLDEAVWYLRKATDLAPIDHLKWSNLGDALWFQDDTDEALEAFETAKQLVQNVLAVNPNDPNTLMDAAWISAMLDDSATARFDIDRSIELAPEDPYAHYIAGLIRLRSGDSEGALASLRIAADKGYPLRIMAIEPHLAKLREDPAFRAIVDRL